MRFCTFNIHVLCLAHTLSHTFSLFFSSLSYTDSLSLSHTQTHTHTLTHTLARSSWHAMFEMHHRIWDDKHRGNSRTGHNSKMDLFKDRESLCCPQLACAHAHTHSHTTHTHTLTHNTKHTNTNTFSIPHTLSYTQADNFCKADKVIFINVFPEHPKNGDGSLASLFIN